MKNQSLYKITALFALILITAVPLWVAPPAVPCYAQGGYQEPPAGGGGGGLPAGYTFLGGKVNQDGVLVRDVTAESADRLCRLWIQKGTRALNRNGFRLTSILIVETRFAPAPPPYTRVIGAVYDLGPDRSTFDPPITITLKYDPAALPQGVNEESLVIIYWDGTAWRELEGPYTRDLENHTISAPLSHFTEFSVIAYTSPAVFSASSLTISPTTTTTGQEVTIDVTVTNTGDLAGSHEVALEIDGEVIDTIEVTLAGRASQIVTFHTTADYAAGDHVISVNGLSGTLTITEPAPPPAPALPPAPPVTQPEPAPPPPAPAPPPVTPAPEPAPPPEAPETAATAINWWHIAAIIAGVIVIMMVLWLVIARRRD